jgi:hypothetical protein
MEISGYLLRNGIEVVLSGGACVTIYTKNQYLSHDLDFVLISAEKQKEVRRLLLTEGFFQETRYFRHKNTEYFLDFVSPPLSVGNEPVKEISEIKRGRNILKLLSPTDCVKDRLAAYYHWDDRQALEQARLVCKNRKVDLREIRRWSKAERMLTKYDKIKNILSLS